MVPIFNKKKMKICMKILLLFFCQLFYILQNLPLSNSMMGALLSNSLLLHYFLGNRFYINAKCIHDLLDHPRSESSPQTYDRIAHKSENSETINQEAYSYEFSGVTTSSAEYANPTNYHYYYNDEPHQTSRIVGTSASGIESAMLKELGSSEKIKDDNSLSRLRRDAKSPLDSKTDPTVIRQERSAISYDLDEYYATDKREVSQDLFKPIRLTVWYDFDHISYSNTSIEFERLKQGLDRAAEQVQKLLSVIPIQGPLLLSRHDICQADWKDSTALNYGKCGRIDTGYAGEICVEDDFKIPDKHLRGFATFDKNNAKPAVIHFTNGTGVPNTDTVIYVRSENTCKCTDGGVIAYASYCQLDQFNRPVAGYVNFCPNHLSVLYNYDKFYLTVLHELFHVLGFSQKLFKKFQQCKKTHNIENSTYWMCEKRGDAVDYVNKWYRVLTPAVVRESTNHFNCSSIAGPLEGDLENKRESSHWEARYFRSSLMTATIGLPHLTVLDRITVALFEDTGWYKVNMSQSSDLFWGQNAGCEFGSEAYCHEENNPFFCTSSDVVNGCHFLHLDKGVCTTNNLLDTCLVYKAENITKCSNALNYSNASSWTGEIFNLKSRCFLSNLSVEQTEVEEVHHVTKRNVQGLREEGRCYEHRCNDTETLEIRVLNSNWFVCPYGQAIQIPGYTGTIICPLAHYLCHPNSYQRFVPKSGSAVCVSIRMLVLGLQKALTNQLSHGVSKEFFTSKFTKKFFNAVNDLIPGNRTFMSALPYVSGNNVLFQLKSDRKATGACVAAVRLLKTQMQKLAIFMDEVKLTPKGMAYTYRLVSCGPQTSTIKPTYPPISSNTKENPNSERKPPTKHASPSGVIAASAVGGVCIVVFASVVGLLYWKSIVPRAVGPSIGSAPEISYHPNSQESPASISENGSVGQMQFAV